MEKMAIVPILILSIHIATIMAKPALITKFSDGSNEQNCSAQTILIATGYPYKAGVKTELISINEEEDVATTCSKALPDFPEQIEGAVGGNIGNQKPAICGGDCGQSKSNRCYHLDGNTWKYFGNMESERESAGSLIINGDMVIFGGYGAQDSMEWINENGQSIGTTSLPARIEDHAMVKVDDTRSMMIVGYVIGEVSSKTWFYSHKNKEFTPGPQLKEGRNLHAAGLVTDKQTGEKIIIVSGGFDGRLNILKSTELLIDGSWQQGPDMPRKLVGHKMVSIGQDLIVIGGADENLERSKDIFRMKCISRDCSWKKLKQQLKYARRDFVAMPINIECN